MFYDYLSYSSSHYQAGSCVRGRVGGGYQKRKSAAGTPLGGASPERAL